MSFNPLSHSLRPQSLQAIREKKNTLRLEITGPPTIRVRLCQMFGFARLSLPFWKVKTTGQNDLKGPQFSHLPASFGSAHRQPLFQPLQGGEHRRMVRKDLWATVQSVEVRGKQIWAQSERLFLSATWVGHWEETDLAPVIHERHRVLSALTDTSHCLLSSGLLSSIQK